MDGFVTRVVQVDGNPFQLVINADDELAARLVDPWIWTITMKLRDATWEGLASEQEELALQALTDRILADVRAAAPIWVLGTTTYRGQHELMFYASADEKLAVGGAVAEMKDLYEEEEGRLAGFKGRPDPSWSVRSTYSGVA